MNFENELTNLLQTFGLTYSKVGVGFKISLPPVSAYFGTLDIGPDELDWYLTITDKENQVVYEDWIDYAGYDKRTKDQMVQDKLNDIEWFVDKWSNAESVNIEIHKSFFGIFKRKSAEWRHLGIWSTIELCNLNEDQ